MESMIPESVRLLVVGLNHRTATLALREALAFSAEQAKATREEFRRLYPQAELVILSTCNRVEFYIARPLKAAPTLEQLQEFLATCRTAAAGSVAAEAGDLHAHLYHHEDRAMVEHLFAVASSLDSMVVGETQILSQVKSAYLHASEDGAAGKVLHALFQRALAAAKDVHEKTQLSSGRLSVASVAVELAASVFDRFDDKTVVCLGAGKMMALMLKHLAELKPGKVVVTNRSMERAEALAAEFSAQVRPFEALDAALVEADILLTGTGATEPVVSEARFKALLKARRYRPIVIVDIAVPRDVEPTVAKLANVYLYNIDDLQEVAAGNRGKREEAVVAARKLLGEHVEEFLRWFAARDVGPLVKALYEHSHALARGELEAIFARHPEMTAEQKAELEKLTHRLVGKLLHGPVTQLTTRAEATARPMLAAAVKRLFELGDG